jgi:hypothetical protein
MVRLEASSLDPGWRLNRVAYLRGADPEHPQKRTAHRISGLEATGVGDLLEAHGGAVDPLLGGFDAHAVHELTRIHFRFPKTNPSKLPRAHSNSIGQLFDS